jgi:hypothetical protein
MTYSLAYRTGGTHHCQWRRVFDAYETREAAQTEAARLERMGYKANVYETARLDSVGLPVGWNYDSVDWEADRVYVARYVTEHVKAA